jgi:3-hydroxyacyl-CoA dehydrogenase
VIGLHFFSPANVMRLVEVVRGRATSPQVIVTSMTVVRRIGKLPVLVGVCDGFVGNRMVAQYAREAEFLLEEGATPGQVDGALQRFGLAMGRFGQKTGAGFYRYETGSRTPVPDPLVNDIIEQCARQAGIQRRAIGDDEIVERCIYALVNEGAKVLEEGIAQRSSDIDLIYVNGYGFPAWRGGPMFYADSVGLAKVYERICEFHRQHGEFWTPAPLLKRLAGEGKAFKDFAPAAA